MALLPKEVTDALIATSKMNKKTGNGLSIERTNQLNAIIENAKKIYPQFFTVEEPRIPNKPGPKSKVNEATILQELINNTYTSITIASMTYSIDHNGELTKINIAQL